MPSKVKTVPPEKEKPVINWTGKEEGNAAAGAGSFAGEHTPGPWHTLRDPKGNYGIAPDEGVFLAIVQGEANARLIAAAPAMLMALQAMTEEWVDYMTINHLGDPWAKHNMKLARAAIAAATGGKP